MWGWRVGERGREVVGEEADGVGDEGEGGGGDGGIGSLGGFVGCCVWEREVADSEGEGFARDGLDWVYAGEILADAPDLTLNACGCGA